MTLKTKKAVELFCDGESPKYEEMPNGWIEIFDASWESKYFQKVEIEGLYRPVYCNKLIIPALKTAMHAIVRNATFLHEYEYIEVFQCFAPRHIRNNPHLPLSLHTFGIAFDINPEENKVKSLKPSIPMGIVDIFESVGFEWGGRWKLKDYMHFQPREDFFDFQETWIYR